MRSSYLRSVHRCIQIGMRSRKTNRYKLTSLHPPGQRRSCSMNCECTLFVDFSDRPNDSIIVGSDGDSTLRSLGTAISGERSDECFTNTSTHMPCLSTALSFHVESERRCYVCSSILMTSCSIFASVFSFVSPFRQTTNHCSRQSMAGAIILSITYGIHVQPKDDPYIAIAERALTTLNACANAGSYLGNVSPPMQSYSGTF